MAYNNNIMFIRYQLLARLVKMWKENELLEKVDRLPVELHPRKQKPLGRCCVYKERAVTKYKTMAMMGFDMTDETDETERLSTYAARMMERKEIDSEKSILSVMDEACSSCVKINYEVTNLCRGCAGLATTTVRKMPFTTTAKGKPTSTTKNVSVAAGAIRYVLTTLSCTFLCRAKRLVP